MMSQSLTYESLLDRFDISSEDLGLLKECGRVVGPKIDNVCRSLLRMARRTA
jgi:hypothetical protein